MRMALAFLLLISAAPAWAGETSVPEPSATLIFALGVLGIVVGRRGARRDPD